MEKRSDSKKEKENNIREGERREERTIADKSPDEQRMAGNRQEKGESKWHRHSILGGRGRGKRERDSRCDNSAVSFPALPTGSNYDENTVETEQILHQIFFLEALFRSSWSRSLKNHSV